MHNIPCIKIIKAKQHNDYLSANKVVVLAKIMYTSPAWWGFATAADKQRIEAFVRRGVRLGLYQADDPTPAELSADSDDNLFECILSNSHHVLSHLLSE